MKKMILIALFCAVALAGTAFSQAPRSVMAGGLFHSGGERDFAFAVAQTVQVITVPDKGVQDYARSGYIYSNAENELQGIFAFNFIEKTIKYVSPGARWYAAQGEGFVFEIEDGEDHITGAFVFETGIQFGGTVKFGLGVSYEPMGDDPGRTLAYAHFDLFPKLF